MAVIPIGTVIAFGGDVTSPPTGWLPCDGRSLLNRDYGPLFQAIGTHHGGDGTAFNLPDLRGRFVRATAYTSTNDPDAASRTAPVSGAASGDSVGSAQACATGLPTTRFTSDTEGDHAHDVDHLPTEDYDCACAITGNEGAAWNPSSPNTGADGNHNHTLSGGDDETRPVNTYANWLIKVEATASDATMPYGSIALFGGDASETGTVLAGQGWQACQGGSLAVASYPNLYAALDEGSIYGGDSTDFTLPDLRGLFVRGVAAGVTTAEGKGVDPDEHRRFRLDDGSPQSGVGSVQSYATAMPSTSFTLDSAGAHVHNTGYLPTADYIENACAGHAVTNYPSGQVTSTDGAHDHTVGSGGDSESRPLNIYLDYIISADIAGS